MRRPRCLPVAPAATLCSRNTLDKPARQIVACHDHGTGLTGFLLASWDHLGCQSWDHPVHLATGGWIDKGEPTSPVNLSAN